MRNFCALKPSIRNFDRSHDENERQNPKPCLIANKFWKTYHLQHKILITPDVSLETREIASTFYHKMIKSARKNRVLVRIFYPFRFGVIRDTHQNHQLNKSAI